MRICIRYYVTQSNAQRKRLSVYIRHYCRKFAKRIVLEQFFASYNSTVKTFIALLDSGIGALPVLRHCIDIMPRENYMLIRDQAFMPYGDKTAQQIERRVFSAARTVFDMGAKALLLACNTATATSVDNLRALYPQNVIVGLEPAIKPCGYELRNGYAVALVTEATAKSKRLDYLVQKYGRGRIVVHSSRNLAAEIEEHAGDETYMDYLAANALADYKDAESVILGCSHYSFLRRAVTRFYGGNIKIYDGAEGAARYLKRCLLVSGNVGGGDGQIDFFVTNGQRGAV